MRNGLPIVDAHHHLWDLAAVRYPWLTDAIEPHFMFGDYAELRRNYMPDDYLRDSAAQNIVATVHCEAEADRADPVAETRWLTAQHARYGFPNALVVWADFASPGCGAQLAAQCAFPMVRGVRCKPRLPARAGAAAPAGGLEDPAWLAGLALLKRHALSWDLRVPWWYLRDAAAVVARHPELPIILNHCGLPWERDADSLAVWRAGMTALAACPNVVVKVSELGLADRPWSEADNLPIIAETIEIFGPTRALFASNFPVAGLRVGYDRWVAAVDQVLQRFTPFEREAVLSGNALRVYRVTLPEEVANKSQGNLQQGNR